MRLVSTVIVGIGVVVWVVTMIALASVSWLVFQSTLVYATAIEAPMRC